MSRLRAIVPACALVTVAFLVTPASAFFFANSDHALRSGPGGTGRVTGSVAEGQRLGIIKCRNEWCLVAAGKRTGWLDVRFIGVAADARAAPPGLPVPSLPPTWRRDPLGPPDPILGPPKGQLADPDLHF